MLDSRDLQAELDELESRDADDDPLDADEIERRDAIRELADSGIDDWHYGVTLVSEDEFESYAREYAEEVSGIDVSVWPFSCIDWERAAHELSADYTSVEFDGETYYVR